MIQLAKAVGPVIQLVMTIGRTAGDAYLERMLVENVEVAPSAAMSFLRVGFW